MKKKIEKKREWNSKGGEKIMKKGKTKKGEREEKMNQKKEM